MAKRLKYAVVDNSEEIHSLMRKNVNSGSTGDFFFSNKEFGKADIKKYDLIFIGDTGTSFQKEEMAESIRQKTKAIIVIITDDLEFINLKEKNRSDFKVARKRTFETYKEASDFMIPLCSFVEGRDDVKSLKRRITKISKEMHRQTKFA